MGKSELFSVSQLAAALRQRNPQAVYPRLKNCRHRGVTPTRGNPEAKLYAPDELPADVFAEIERFARAARLPVIEYVRNASRPYKSPAAFGKLPAEVRDDVMRWRDVASPILSRRGRKPIAELAREVREALMTTGAEIPCARTCERRIATALDRAGIHESFSSLDLYIIEDAKGVAAPTDEKPSSETVAAAVEDADEISRWLLAMEQADLLIERGVSEKKAKARLIETLLSPDERDDARRRHRVQQKWKELRARWLENPCRASIVDRREKPEMRCERYGRPPKFTLTRDEAMELRGWVLRKESFPVAIEWFVKSDQCLLQTRELILAELDRAARLRILPNWPDSIRRAGRVTVDESAAFRGRKAFMEVEFVDRRGLEWIDATGTRLPMAPNTIWESDDMSSNEPFTWAERGRDGAQILRIGRQTLCTLDVYSGAWLGVSPIGRERDAYRAEDIADHVADCVRAYGLPTIWRMERGPWENNFVDGVLIGHDAEGREIRWGGLDPLITIVRAWKSRQKGTIESSFNFLQTLLAHESTSIGRHRGEFEAQTKLYLRASKGEPDEWARFWPMAECAEGFALAMQRANHRPKKRRAHGPQLVVPADLYHGAVRREVPDGEWWRFCPEKREATVRQGHIECTVKHYPLTFRFQVNGVRDGLYLEHSFPVLIAFHPGHPERGCHVFNAERGPRNREGWHFGEPLLVAPMAIDAPQVNLAPHERAMHARKNTNATMRAEFRAVSAVGGAPVRRSVARDGWGNSATAETGMRDAPQPTTPRRREDGKAEIDRAMKMENSGGYIPPEDDPRFSDEALAELDRRKRKLQVELGLAEPLDDDRHSEQALADLARKENELMKELGL